MPAITILAVYWSSRVLYLLTVCCPEDSPLVLANCIGMTRTTGDISQSTQIFQQNTNPSSTPPGIRSPFGLLGAYSALNTRISGLRL